jgi:hypothetical protein
MNNNEQQQTIQHKEKRIKEKAKVSRGSKVQSPGSSHMNTMREPFLLY